ncbi:MAG: hypothetical protein K2W96_10530, partial [Gemmataceae bacterium]|nr:hypothetical protein [Gemmataceae bacterium]
TVPPSVHLRPYPTPDESLIDTALVEEMDALRNVVSLGGAARNTAKQKTRQPLAELRVSTKDERTIRAVERFNDLILDELNVKKVSLGEGGEGWAVAQDEKATVSLDPHVTPELAAEGMARDAIRAVQHARKEAKLQIEDRIMLYLSAEGDLGKAIDAHWPYIAGETLATSRAATPPGPTLVYEGLTISLAKA